MPRGIACFLVFLHGICFRIYPFCSQEEKREVSLFLRAEAMANFRFLEDIAIADAAFEAYGDTLEELFETCALATFEVMVDTGSVKPLFIREIMLENDSVDGLLMDWLSELVFIKDAESLLFSVFNVNIRKNQVYELKASASGEKIDREKHLLRSDVKAVTYHMFEVVKKDDNWIARVVLDI